MIYNGQETGASYRLTFPFTSQNIRWSENPGMTKEYKRILTFRNESEAIRRGQLTSFGNDDICAFVRKLGYEKVLVIINLRDRDISYPVNQEHIKTTWTDVKSGDKIKLNEEISLQPYTYLILRNKFKKPLPSRAHSQAR